ncbi:heparinase II/III family protein [Akkermansiaceae bacterium]|nr:heparinase II/III family protein [Akkermansiaceae bacterium]
MKSFLKLKALWRLGPVSIARVAGYRLGCKSGTYRKRLPVSNWRPLGDLFSPGELSPPQISDQERAALLTKADDLLAGKLTFFSSVQYELGSPPNWFLDPIKDEVLTSTGHWAQLDEFAGGDIKLLWEASRFEWAPRLAQAWRLSGDQKFLEALNLWIVNWIEQNPINQGPNWKCGQEASIRLINLLLTARLLGVDQSPSDSLVKLVSAHCRRVLLTIRYAIGQDNNHGTSEAAALFIGGSWLASVGEKPSEGKLWQRSGRKWLENRVRNLIGKDGSFSQYSVNYHRVLLDTLCQVEFWRRELKCDAFSNLFYERSSAAVDWLNSLIDKTSGDVPNMGANDGARLFDLSTSAYRDYRPTIEMGSFLFQGKSSGGEEFADTLYWLGISRPKGKAPARSKSVIHRDGGDVVLRSTSSHSIIRFAKFRFRPSHADCLHLDLWHRGMNILRDGGTYSYNKAPETLDYFSGTESHNTVQFDGRNQMPRLGRFLFGAWLKMDECSGIERNGDALSWSGAYTDWKKARHHRSVKVDRDLWTVTDQVGGVFTSARLRWRLVPAKWLIDENSCHSGFARISVLVDGVPVPLVLSEGWESRHYMRKTPLPVIEIELPKRDATVVTHIELL